MNIFNATFTMLCLCVCVCVRVCTCLRAYVQTCLDCWLWTYIIQAFFSQIWKRTIKVWCNLKKNHHLNHFCPNNSWKLCKLFIIISAAVSIHGYSIKACYKSINNTVHNNMNISHYQIYRAWNFKESLNEFI